MGIKNAWRRFFRRSQVEPTGDTKNTGKVENPSYPDIRGAGSIRRTANTILYDQYLQDLESYRYSKDADDLIDRLSRSDSDMGNAVYNFLIALDSGVDFSVVDDRSSKLSRSTLRLNSLLKRFKGNAIDRSISSIIRQMGRLCLVRGACGLEVITDELGRVSRLNVIDPKWVDWVREGDEFVAYQNNTKVSSDFLYWCFIDPDVDSPQHISLILSALQPIFFRIGVLQDLEKVVDRAGWARLHANILEDVMIRNAPASVRRNAESLRGWMESRRLEVQKALTDLRPEDAIVHYNSAEVDYLSPQTGGHIDIEPLMRVLDQQISSGLKALPSILGRGSGTEGDTESVLYVRGVKFFQKTMSDTLENVFNFCLQLEGVRGNTVVKFHEVDLRSPNEIENHKIMKQKRVLELATIGFVTVEDACMELTGKELPKGFDEQWFQAYREQHLGLTLGTTDDDDSDNGNYNQQADEQKPGDDSIDTRSDDEKADNITKAWINVLGGR